MFSCDLTNIISHWVGDQDIGSATVREVLYLCIFVFLYFRICAFVYLRIFCHYLIPKSVLSKDDPNWKNLGKTNFQGHFVILKSFRIILFNGRLSFRI